MKNIMYLGLFSLLLSCQGPEVVGQVDQNAVIIEEDIAVPLDLSLIQVRDVQEQDIYIDPCDGVTIDQYETYCGCHPECCSQQEWYCPPQPGNAIESMRVVVEVCNDQGQSCQFGEDPDCPPPQILHQGPCQVAFECPPGSSRDFLRWFECQLADGRTGRQRVLCDKGIIVHGACTSCEEEVCNGLDDDCDNRIDEDPIVCEDDCGEGVGICRDGVILDCVNREPSEDICNFIDDDCDGLTDEGQRNACDECGELPQDTCNGLDDDCDGVTDELLIRECETPCERGVESCIDGRWGSCTARPPVDEECDGFDNDCDGVPDEGINCLCTVDQVGALFPCSEEPLKCGIGFKTCECLDVDCDILQMGDCKALCAHFPPVQGQECNSRHGRPTDDEVCNNFDEDCDNSIDENLTRACYTGPRDTLNIGICLPGEQSCIDGLWGGPDNAGVWAADICAGETVPEEEVCDGADNDCDGEVDYGEEVRDTDILLVLDTSGSMTGEIRAVTQALARFGQHFAAEDAIHWGLIIGPTRTPDPDNARSSLEVLTMVTNISEFRQFFADFISLDANEFDGGLEMHMDAVMMALRNIAPQDVDLNNRDWVRGVVSIPEKENFVINWRPNTDRIIIVFTDEDEQSYMNPEFHRNDLEQALLNAANTKMYTFALSFYGWDELAVASGGRNFNLSANAVKMYENLMTIIDEICLPRGDQNQGAFFHLEQDYKPVSSSQRYFESRGICI